MAGLNCGTPSLLAWEIMNQGTEAFISISDDFALQAMKLFFYPTANDQRIASGESGAAGLAGLLALFNDPGLKRVKEFLEPCINSRILIFNTEGITDPEFFTHYVI
jgi:diaminopropionate ammonia-lyase